MLLVADRVVTLGHGRYRARAVLVRGRRVAWVGDDPEEAPPHTDRVELAGCTLGPAFVDAHVHLTGFGLLLTGLDLSGCASWAEVVDAVRAYAGQHVGRVIWGAGYDPHRFADAPPDPAALQAAARGMAVFLSRVDGHSALVDAGTLSAAPLSRAAGVERDAEGRPTGVVRGEAHHIVRRWAIGAMTTTELERARHAAAHHAAAHGIGSVHEMGGPDIMGREDFEAWIRGRWPIEVIGYWGEPEVRAAAELGVRRIGGDLFLDGSLGSHTAALCAPYADRPGWRGELLFDDATLTDLLREATVAGLQVGVHAIGDAAIGQLVRCWRAARQALPAYLRERSPELRHRIEHAELIPPTLLDDLAELGLVVSAQPNFDAAWGGPGGLYEARLGAQRAEQMNPWRQLADRGVPLALGSDAPVTPMDPWLTVYAATHPHHPRHALNRLEAISAATLGGRYAAHQDGMVGVIRAGMRADLAAWEGDPFTADDPRGSRCVLTVVQGRVAHGDAPLPRWDETTVEGVRPRAGGAR